MNSDWLIFQLADSAFPTGAFAHSHGLEAAWQLGEVTSREELTQFLRQMLAQSAHSTAPFVAAVMRNHANFGYLDGLLHAMLTNPVARRASITQGQALLACVTRIFDREPLKQLQKSIRSGPKPGHVASVFGAIYRELGFSIEQAVSQFLFLQLRGLVSAAVRLGLVGPIEGQAIQGEVSKESEQWIRRAMSIEDMNECAQIAPAIDHFWAFHDRLYSRLFVS